jgi:hypothetical protein
MSSTRRAWDALSLDEATVTVLQDAALQKFAETGVHDISVIASQDHSGEPVILVQINHHLVPGALDLRKIIEGDSAVRDAAWQNGERRFVYVHHQYDEKQEVASKP